MFNRLVIWDAHLIHSATDYFGHSPETGRLFQMFFFDSEPLSAAPACPPSGPQGPQGPVAAAPALDPVDDLRKLFAYALRRLANAASRDE